MFSNMTRSANGLPPKPGETDAEGSADGKAANVWSAILQNVKAQDNVALPSDRSVVVLGDNESGKTTLIAKLQGNEDPRKGSGLEYAYIDVRDEYRDDQTRLNVWILDGEAQYQHLLQFALTEKSVENTLVVLTVSMTKPWQILDSLQTWATVLQDHVDKLNLDVKAVRRLQRRVATRWREYVEPGDELEATQNMAASMTASMIKTSDTSDGRGDKKGENGEDDDDDDPSADEPLPDGVLTRNLGLDVIVVVTKTDYMAHLEKEDYREEHFDFIQQAVRKFCLQYGAALFYTSVKDDKNCDLLYKYLVHRIYGLQFRTPALVVEKDAIFIPAGWDNGKKIAIVYENMHSVNPDDYFTDVIAKPAARKIGGGQRDLEVAAEDDQVFLGKHQQASSAAPPGATNAAAVTNGPAAAGMKAAASPTPMAIQKTGSDRRSSGNLQAATPKKLDTSGSANLTSEGVLANFFNSLLSKKPPTPSSAGGSTSAASSLRLQDKITSRADAAAELDRIAAQTKRSLSNAESPSGPSSSSDC